jgi:glutathione synthase/RimK-type ligase-like ATP-grasp enzyme
VSVSNVVIIAPPHDEHAITVNRRLQQLGQRSGIFDLEAVVRAHVLFNKTELIELDATQFDTRTCVWWRRPTMPRANREIWDGSVRSFVADEWRHMLYGSLYAAGCTIVNDPVAEARAAYKPYQLHLAGVVGLRTPLTCITNDVSRAAAFVDTIRSGGGNVVYKALTSPRYHMGETRLLDSPIDPEELELAPVIFQEFVPKGVDVRVTIVGQQLFAAKVHTRYSGLVDWRVDPEATYEAFEIPPQIADDLVQLMETLGLRLGSFDLRVSASGDWFFLEVNPSGQFLFLEAACGWPISTCVARLLGERS